jgi:hypothetical protein
MGREGAAIVAIGCLRSAVANSVGSEPKIATEAPAVPATNAHFSGIFAGSRAQLVFNAELS